MNKKTEQMSKWSGSFGKEYTIRNNPSSFDDWEESFKNSCYGITRTAMNIEFIGNLERYMRILEVGSNIGNQLLCLNKMGFQHLYGIELQEHAVKIAKQKTKRINFAQGSAFDIPYENGAFDLVFTSGVLIHIAPTDIMEALKEIHRCTNKYIWGLEYFAEEYTQVTYRGNKELLWKTDFKKLYLDNFKDLNLVKEKKFKYLRGNNVDSMFLLQKN